ARATPRRCGSWSRPARTSTWPTATVERPGSWRAAAAMTRWSSCWRRPAVAEPGRSGERQRFQTRLAPGEALEAERRDVERARVAVGDQLGHQLSGDGAVHEAVAAEAGDDVQAGDPGHSAHDAGLVRRHLVEARPRPHELGVFQHRRPAHGALHQRLRQAPVEHGAERSRLGPAADAEQNAGTLTPYRDPQVRVDDERRGLRNLLE